MTPNSFKAPKLSELQTLLPAFEVEAFIAQGGMGAVYKAKQRSLDRDVAIKILPREFGSNPDFLQSFETEARAMARLNHPNLIGVYDSGNAGGLPYIVMEFVRGKSLFHSCRGKAIEDRQSAELIIGICRGLAHAHEGGIIHRDIKPANILLTPQREPKIGDFGLAQPSEADGEGLAMGSPGYIAPEIYQNPTNASERSDIFAVGVILYELLTGKLPDSRHTPPSAIVGTDPQLDKIWERASHPDPARRYAKVDEMRRDLELWLNPTSKPIEQFNPRPRPLAKVGPNWPLLRNLVIIVLLLWAIGAVWNSYQEKQESRAAKLSTPTGNLPTSTAPPSKPSAQRSDASPPPPDPSRSPAPSPVAQQETPAESLTRLRSKLLEGFRDEFPANTIRSETSAYYFVATPRTWEEARFFAENHGGNLALLTDDDSRTWLAKNFTGATTWLGARTTQDKQWRQLDGSSWPLDESPRGSGSLAALKGDGTVIAGTPTARHPFLIQWELDGSNPCSLEALLTRTMESLESSAPFFPPGTITANDSYYLFVTRPITAPEARRLAAIGGAHLIVPSDPAEADWLASQITNTPSSGPFLLGATRKDALWRWDTGEAWTFARWANEPPSAPGNTLVIDGREGWKHWRLEDEAAGFILEWSQPDSVEENDNRSELQTKASDLLTQLNDKRRKELQENTKAMVWKLDGWLRNSTKENIRRFTPPVEKLKKASSKDRVPRFLLHADERTLPPPVIAFKKAANEKQDRIDKDFELQADKVREAYLKRISDLIVAERERGQPDLARELEGDVLAAADLHKWITSLGIVDADGSPVFSAIEILSAKYGSRGKHADVTARVKELIEVEEKPFRVLVSYLGVDPDPGWNKSVRISFVVNGQTFERWWSRNSSVSPAILMEHAAAKMKPVK